MSPRACASVVPVSSSAVYKDPFVTHTLLLAARSLQIWATCTLEYWCVLAENGILVLFQSLLFLSASSNLTQAKADKRPAQAAQQSGPVSCAKLETSRPTSPFSHHIHI